MRSELLQIPERRHSNIPELLSFFGSIGAGDGAGLTLRFLRAFAGTQFTLPGPDFFREIARDEAIVAALEDDQGTESRIRILRKHRISYARMENVFRLCTGRSLDSPSASGKEQAIEDAAAIMRRHKNLTADIAMMYALNARDRARAEALSQKKPSPEARPIRLTKLGEQAAKKPGDAKLTKSQRTVLEKIGERPCTPRELARMLKTICPTKTLKSLREKGLITSPDIERVA